VYVIFIISEVKETNAANAGREVNIVSKLCEAREVIEAESLLYRTPLLYSKPPLMNPETVKLQDEWRVSTKSGAKLLGSARHLH